MEFTLTDWEQNGYHDSYFYVSVWNTETRTLRAMEYGSTAYGGGAETPPVISDPAVLQDAIAWLAEYIFGVIRKAEHADVMEPQAAPKYADMRLVRNVKHKGETLAAGLEGRVFWAGAYGQFYRNSYNRPCRGNTRVGLELTDGRKVFVGLNALRLAREPMSDAELRQRAADLALHCGFSQATGVKCAWDSRNYALELLKKTESIAA